MRIGILTQHFLRNYGGILQNWALQQVLIKLGHTPLTFEHDTCYSRRRWLMRTTKQVLQKRSLNNLPQYPYKGRIGHKPFIHFILKNLCSVPVHDFTRNLEAKYGIDAYIVGSDQVWRPAFNLGRLYNMYLDFASDSVKKIAYAASFGVSEWEYNSIQTKRCKELVQRFSAVSVREDSGIMLCNDYLAVKAQLVLDPTLLLDRSDYERITINIPKEKPYVFVYALYLNDKIVELASKKSKELKIGIKILQAGNNLKKGDSIEKWVASFRDAAYIITDSFHGMAFSIIFNKPFLIVKNDSGGNARYYSLLKQFGLENRIVNETANLPIPNIDWQSVNEKRESLRYDSINFLKIALG